MNGAVWAWRDAGEFFEFDGHRIFYRRQGGGPTVLLVHGYPFGSYEWHRIWDGLTANFDVIAPDMLGMGFSDKPIRSRYGLLMHADMHEALLRYLGVDRCAVVGHDLGVSVVQEMLARRCDDPTLPSIDAAVFLNGGLFAEAYRPRPIQKILSSPAGHLIGPLLPRSAIGDAVAGLFGPDAKPTKADLEPLLDLLRHNGGRYVSHIVGRFVEERRRLRDRLVRPLIDNVVPMTFVNGMADPNSGAHMAARYRELVPNPQVVALHGVGHWPHIEAPDATAQSILGFLSRTERGTA
ncbi:alpha/beta fold hydrolase [Nocardia lijiangensis]|uniref:alpha/beta fold hydrolase n=1 Tax=Nocardia lijiangensis TaxID=299618 RepID=UPI00083519B8|nr:alpha/beta hydrolase [Nocardia lijiangensis]